MKRSLVHRMTGGQKGVLVGTLLVFFALVALHNPFGGYSDYETVDVPALYTPSSRAVYRDGGQREAVAYTKRVHRDLDFFDYQSRNAVFTWIDEIDELAGWMVPLFLFSGIAMWVLKPTSSHQSADE